MDTPISDTTPIIGEAPTFMAMLEDVSRVAALSKSVLIIGERGTGKELVATRLHYLSPRWDEPFVKLNCAALTESLLDSELFGHEAGSFTGAAKRHVGRKSHVKLRRRADARSRLFGQPPRTFPMVAAPPAMPPAA